MNWIKIDDQPPEIEVPIIVFGEERICIARLMSKTIFKEKTTFSFYVDQAGYEELWITPEYWMPLPLPPDKK